jgi:hypothetical protein
VKRGSGKANEHVYTRDVYQLHVQGTLKCYKDNLDSTKNNLLLLMNIPKVTNIFDADKSN